MMEQDNEWKISAIQREYEFFETLGSRHYDEIDKTDLFQLKKKIGFATCGKPSEMPCSANYNTGYTTEELIHIKSVCSKVVEKSDYNPIRFSCTILILNHKGICCETPVFRIVTSAGNIFIDPHARVYQSWELFMRNNILPDCEYCYPLNGEYDTDKELLVGFAFSPASSFLNKATSCLDTAGSVAAVAAAGVLTAGAFVSVAPVAVAAAGTTALCTGVYNVTRSVSSLYNRHKHEQSIGLKDPESRSAWTAIGSSALGVTQVAALKGAQKVVESGRSLSKITVLGLHALTASSLALSGFGFVENLFFCADKYSKGNLTKKDIFDLSCELLFLFNAIASARATSRLVNSMNLAAGEASSSQKKLTKTQKRNLRKRAAKRRAKGIPVNVIEEPHELSGRGISTTLKLLLFEAVRVYAPRLEEILYTCQSIGHDITCWRTKEMSDLELFKNLGRNLIRLYNDFKDEITEVTKKVLKFLSSVLDNTLQLIYKLFETASYEVQSIFCTKVINAEDQMELLISEADGEITVLYEDLEINSSTFDCSSVDKSETHDDDDDDDNLNPEAQSLLTRCGDVINSANLSCNNLEDFEDVLDGLKYVIVSKFKDKKDYYKKSLEAAKAASDEHFNIETFHEKLGIRGDVSQHMFNETLKSATACETLYELKTKLKDIKKGKNKSTTPVWEALTEGMFHYYGPHGTGDLKQHELVSVVESVVTIDEKRLSLTKGNYKLIKERDVVVISINDQPNIEVVVYCGITEENTASGIIMVVK